MNQTFSLTNFLRHRRQQYPEEVFLVNEELSRAFASEAATAADQVLYLNLVRLLGIVESLAAVCVFVAMVAGCASPTPMGQRDAISRIVSHRAVSSGGTSLRPRRS